MIKVQQEKVNLPADWRQKVPSTSDSPSNVSPQIVNKAKMTNLPGSSKKVKNDGDKADAQKKRNRRRERQRKQKINDSSFVVRSENPLSNSTPHSSPKPQLVKISSVSEAKYHLNVLLKDVGKNQGRKSEKLSRSERKSSIQSQSKDPALTNMAPFTFKLRSIKTRCYGTLFRTRNKKHKHIKLQTFLGSNTTCIFESQAALLTKLLKNLSLNPERKMRKYFETVPESIESGISDNSISRREFSSNETPNKSTGTGQKLKNRSINDENESVSSSFNGENDKTPRSRRRGPRKPRSERKRENELNEHFPPTLVKEEVLKGLESGELKKGFVRINPKNSKNSYISNTDSALSDYQITSVLDRNAALDGDEVVFKIKPESEWQDGQKTCTVVYIWQKIHPRTTVGTLELQSGYPGCAVFVPRDKRMPQILIPEVCWPIGFKANPRLFENVLVCAKILEWTVPSKAMGVITDTLGKSDDLRVETMAILKEFGLDTTPFSAEMVQYLPKSKDIPTVEMEKREDIRQQCIFTIDPLTARDLDDAVSVKELPNGRYEVGVHISDASHYLPEGTLLDNLVSLKATTIYLVDNVYHMLPYELCLHCSLLPGEDKLAFSVFWEMDEKGEIYNTRFSRTILNSCAQLAYEHAQQMIENPDRQFKNGELPTIHNGFTAKDLSKTVNILQKIAVNLRDARVENGALRIDQVKLLFALDPRSGEPIDFRVYDNKESHRLIEEFMLLANISVAKQIEHCFPDIAFLRCHEPPKSIMLQEAQKSLESCGILMDVSSSGGISASLKKYITDDYQGRCRGIVLNHIFAKPMTRARYFCAGAANTDDGYSHYALSVPIYTHFTSPIRRYADIMVHRLLAASLGYAEKPNWTLDQVMAIAAKCNGEKYNAKRAGEASSDLYLAHYIDKHQPYIQECVVVDVKERSLDAIVLQTGSVVRVHQKTCQDNPKWQIEPIPCSKLKSGSDKKVFRLTLVFPKTSNWPQPQTLLLEMFSVVRVQLKKVPNSYKLEPLLLRPVPSLVINAATPSVNDVSE